MTMLKAILIGWAIVAIFKVLPDETASALLQIALFGPIAIAGLFVPRDIARRISSKKLP